MKKIFNLFSIAILMINCNNDCDSVAVNILTAPVELSSSDGQNLFNNNDFDISLLKISTTVDPIRDLSFFIDEVNSKSVIRIDLPSIDGIIFQYDNENKANLNITNLITESDNCGVITTGSFTASSNGQIICECNLGDILNIEFDI